MNLRPLAALALAGLLAAGCGSGSSPSQSSTATGTSRAATPSSGSRSGGRGTAQAAARQVPRLVLPAHSRPHTVRVPILMYHRVHVFSTELKKSVPALTVEPTVFRSEIAALARAGFHTVTQDQLYEALFHGRPLPHRPVLITVDDGYIDGLKEILPVLRAHHMVATFYIITGRFHEPGFLNATEVRRLDAAGMDIGAHTETHADLPPLPAAVRRREIDGSRHALERVLGHPVYYFAYPYGAENSAVVSEVKRAGFVLAVTTAGGTRESSLAPLTMPRIEVVRTETARGVLACVSAPAGCGGSGTSAG